MARHPPYRLYLLYMDGCDVCAAVKPQVRKWAEAHPLVRYIESDLTRDEWKAKSWEPSEVPTLMLMRPDRRVFIKSGPWDTENCTPDIDEWAKRVTHGAKEVS